MNCTTTNRVLNAVQAFYTTIKLNSFDLNLHHTCFLAFFSPLFGTLFCISSFIGMLFFGSFSCSNIFNLELKICDNLKLQYSRTISFACCTSNCVLVHLCFGVVFLVAFDAFAAFESQKFSVYMDLS